jgi:hypothetical protein
VGKDLRLALVARITIAMHWGRKLRPLPPRAVFMRQWGRQVALSAVIMAISLGIGVLGYREFAGLSWIDALLNAAMILGGEGPVNGTPTDVAKLFASFYALFSGVIFITVAGLVVAPVAHRLLHRFHLEASEPMDVPLDVPPPGGRPLP